MPRPTSALSRKEAYKEAKKFCYIATEDSKTGAYEYFDQLGQTDEYRFLEKYSFKLDVIPSKDGESSPSHVFENIKNKRESLSHEGFDIGFDGFWIVCDVDRWGQDNINSIIDNCENNQIDYAFSNPCSEIWILYHQETFDNDEIYSSSSECKKAATALLQKRKAYCNLLTIQQIDYARDHAEKSHKVKSDKWPTSQGSHLYKLLDYLLS